MAYWPVPKEDGVHAKVGFSASVITPMVVTSPGQRYCSTAEVGATVTVATAGFTTVNEKSVCVTPHISVAVAVTVVGPVIGPDPTAGLILLKVAALPHVEVRTLFKASVKIVDEGIEKLQEPSDVPITLIVLVLKDHVGFSVVNVPHFCSL